MMNRILILLALLIVPSTATAGKLTYDLVRYTAPAPWKKVAWIKNIKKVNDVVSWTMTDKKTGTYCQIFIFASIPSEGDITADFDSEWKTTIVPYGVKEAPQMTDAAEEDGWTVKAGVGTFAFDGGTSIAMLTTVSGHDRVTSIVAVMSSEDYVPAVQALLGSVEMQKPKTTTSAPTKSSSKGTAKPAALQGYMNYNPITKTWQWQLRYPPPQ
ncbi:MAG: hypothetical protein JWP01_2403 [Myxococcales bacterium]|nr:hypothetical protein [Myxococcales bacterium]